MKTTETTKCPQCRIGMDVDLVEIEDAVMTDYFWHGERICPNCGCEVVIHKTGNVVREYIKDTGEVPF